MRPQCGLGWVRGMSNKLSFSVSKRMEPGSDRFRAVSRDFGRPCADRVDKPPKQPPLALRRRVTPRRGGAGNPGACKKRSRRGRTRCSTRPQANQLCDRVGQKMLTFCFRAPRGGRTVLALQKRPRYAPGPPGPASRKAFREAGASPRAESPAVSEYSWGKKC